MPGIGVHHTDTSDAAWDGGANVARLRSGEDRAYFGKVYAWRDPDGDDSVKSSYKFPHHLVSGDGTPGAAVMAGCSAAIAALNGARTAPDIPDSDRQAVWSHLAAHLRDGDREPPPLQDELVTTRRARLAQTRRSWYRIQDAADDVAEVYIYDEISWLGVTASAFVQDLAQIKAPAITLHLSTPGGDVFDGVAIYNALVAHPATVTTSVDSLAASIGSVIAMAGDRVVMAPHSRMMIHDPYALVIGNAADMRKEAAVLDDIGDLIAGIYAERAGGSVREWRDLMAEETWYAAQGAVDAGLADEVGPSRAPLYAAATFDLSLFRNTPADLGGNGSPRGELTKRDVEAALRDAGLSKAQAVAVLAGGWPSDRRDAELERMVATLRELTL